MLPMWTSCLTGTFVPAVWLGQKEKDGEGEGGREGVSKGTQWQACSACQKQVEREETNYSMTLVGFPKGWAGLYICKSGYHLIG